jgi:redox-sensitive bicupin YhaK (pirin superfamily)
VHALVRPGELNLMTAGYGVAHSEGVEDPPLDDLVADEGNSSVSTPRAGF